MACWVPFAPPQVALELNSVLLCTLMLASILRAARSFVSEREEAEFMALCICPGSSGSLPAPRRMLAAHWELRCEASWRRAVHLLMLGIPMFFANLAVAAWIQFEDSVLSAILVTALLGAGLLLLAVWLHKWAAHVTARGTPDPPCARSH